MGADMDDLGSPTTAKKPTKSVRSQRSNQATDKNGTIRRRRKSQSIGSPGVVAVTEVQFTPEMAVAGLSQLGKTADGLRAAYLSLTVTGTNLATADPLASYVHVQTVDLNGNQLTDISALGNLKSLTKLDVSHNSLKQVLDLRMSGSDSNLRTANFGFNQVVEVADLSRFTRLQTLCLDSNAVQRLGGSLSGLRMLRSLSLANNKLTSCQGLEELSNLRTLDLSDNCVTSLEALTPLSGLQELLLARNAVTGLLGTRNLRGLRRLDLSDNRICRLEELAHVCGAALLGHLSLSGNPVCLGMSFRLHVVYMMPQVCQLDATAVDAQEKVMAANMHGADAEELRLVRRKYFPNGELDDGGGAIPPLAAGLVASQAEEETAEDVSSAFLRIDAWARSVQSSTGGASGLVGLADQLSSVCSGQLQSARVLYQWLAVHLVPPSEDQTWQVDAPLFGPAGEDAEKRLLGDVSGMWAERAAWLFVHLARACELEAVAIPGFWRHARLLPGTTLTAHNHCWTAIKVNGRWRLLDCTLGALSHGHASFFIPPSAWIYSYFPLEAAWQLMDDPMALDDWWALPHCSTDFFAKGCTVLDPNLHAVNVLPAPKAGRPLPSVSFRIAAPTDVAGMSLAHALLDEQLRPVACWPVADANEGPQMAFQQVEGSAGVGSLEVAFGAKHFGCSVFQVWTSLPGPGVWYIRLQVVMAMQGAMTLNIDGLPAPLELLIKDVSDCMLVKVILPPVEPHDPLDGILADPSTPPALLPFTHPAFTARRCQLVSPSPDAQLEADCSEDFVLVVPPGVERIGLVTRAGNVMVLSGVDESNMLASTIFVPRSSSLKVVMFEEHEGHEGATAVPLLTLHVHPERQHMTVGPADVAAPPIEPDSTTEARNLYDLFGALDANGDGLVTKFEMLTAFRRNRQFADILKFPPKICGGDGTLERFHELFLQIDRKKWGFFTYDELAAHMGILPREVESDGDSQGNEAADGDTDDAGDSDYDDGDAAESCAEGPPSP